MIVSDEAGEVAVREADADGLQSAVKPWLVAWEGKEKLLSSRELWVYRLVDLAITAKASPGAEEPLDLGEVSVGATPGDPPDSNVASTPEDPWNSAWIKHHCWGARRIVAPVDSAGHASLRVPRIRGVAVRAQAEGWVSERIYPPFASYDTDEPIPILIELQPLPSVTVRVTGERGEPLANAIVRTSYRVVQDVDSVNADQMKTPGFTLQVLGLPDGTAYVSRDNQGVTDENGEITLLSPGEGEIILTAHAEGYHPGRILGGEVIRESQFDVPLASSGSRPVTLLWREMPLAGADLFLTDITDLTRQTTVGLILNAKGEAPGEWFVRGRAYQLTVKYLNAPQPEQIPPGSDMWGYIVWDERKAIEVSTLTHDLEDVR